MPKINLRDYYPHYNSDLFIDIPDEVAAVLLEAELQDKAYTRRMYRHHAQYSLDCCDGIEHDILFVSLSPWEIYERKCTYEQLHAAIAKLPDKQAKRIYAYYFMDMSQSSIAKAEGVSRKAVCSSIIRGLLNLERILKNIFREG
ncbi:MAG: sigma factor-like helix-turn-helix DNA-binding protein [Oscillospiraceae bacterium]|nr:sigma factor-like helix-turn-helix DNA-binding protein [Oscillospiraceae bacterium]